MARVVPLARLMESVEEERSMVGWMVPFKLSAAIFIFG